MTGAPRCKQGLQTLACYILQRTLNRTWLLFRMEISSCQPYLFHKIFLLVALLCLHLRANLQCKTLACKMMQVILEDLVFFGDFLRSPQVELEVYSLSVSLIKCFSYTRLLLLTADLRLGPDLRNRCSTGCPALNDSYCRGLNRSKCPRQVEGRVRQRGSSFHTSWPF